MRWISRLGRSAARTSSSARPFVVHVRAVRGRQRIERPDVHRRALALTPDAPGAAHDAIDEDRAQADGPLAEEHLHPLVGAETGPVCVAEEHVVVFRQVTHWRRRVRVWPRSVRQVEELAAALVAERHEARSEAIHDLAQPADPGPGADVRHARRPERRQVADHQGIDVGLGLHGPPEPGLDRREGRRPTALPEAAWRDLDERQEVGQGVRQRGTVMVGPALGHQGCQLGAGLGSLVEPGTPGCHERVGLDPRHRPTEWALAMEHSIEDGSDEWPDGQEVIVGRQVEGASHQAAAHRSSLLDDLGKLGGLEALEPAPERDVGILRHLGLHADEVLDHLRGRHRDPGQEVLSCKRRAVEGPQIEHRLGRAPDARIGHPARWPVVAPKMRSSSYGAVTSSWS